MPKYKKSFNQMMSDHKALFDNFKVIHDKFKADNKKYSKEFNTQGEKVIEIVRKYENELCGTSDTSGFGKFTTKLAEKFLGEVRNVFSELDEIGIEYS